VERSFGADSSKEGDDEDFLAVASSLCGREEEARRRGERRQRGGKGEKDSLRSELSRSLEKGDRERRSSSPPVKTEMWNSFPTS
jgi:hypothetical protein